MIHESFIGKKHPSQLPDSRNFSYRISLYAFAGEDILVYHYIIFF